MNKNLKKRIIDSFTRKTPDLRSQIIERCSSEDQLLLSEESIVKTQCLYICYTRHENHH